MDKKTDLTDISVVIPCYNGMKFMPQLIACLKPYYKKGVEIVLVEDGSDDGTQAVFLEAFPEAVYHRQENAGPAMARYTGAKLAKGDFIQFLDVDDTISDDKLYKQLDYALLEQLDVVYSDWRYAIEQSDQSIVYGEWIENDTFQNVVWAMFNGWWFPPASALIKKMAFLAINGGNTDLRATGDETFVYLMLYCNGFKFGYLPGHFTHYYRHQGLASLSQKRNLQWWKDFATASKDTIAYLNANHALTDETKHEGLNYLFSATRNLAKFSHVEALKIWKFIQSIDASFVPENESGLFKTMLKLLGYSFAERLAAAILFAKKVKNGTAHNAFRQDNFIYQKLALQAPQGEIK